MQSDDVPKEDLSQRLERFALRVLKMVRSLSSAPENKIYGQQVLRSSSSMGANYAEAACATSRRDFTNDLNRVRKEAHETVYWLGLIVGANPDMQLRMAEITKEAKELFLIFNRAVKTSKGKGQK